MAEFTRDWQLRGFTPETHAHWNQHRFRARTAKRWSDAGFVPEEALEFRASKIKVSAARQWMREIEDTGFDLTDVLAMIAQGLRPEDVAQRWAEYDEEVYGEEYSWVP